MLTRLSPERFDLPQGRANLSDPPRQMGSGPISPPQSDFGRTFNPAKWPLTPEPLLLRGVVASWLANGELK
jgi:hypothetical protein